jgi:lipid-A-disaccharide synthase
LRRKLPGLKVAGVGGSRMREAGVELLCDSSVWSAIGITEAVKVLPRLLFAFHSVRKYLKAHPPDLLILIDFGFFNVRIAKGLPDSVKVLYYFPPGSWRKNAGLRQLGGVVDRIVTPFAWSEACLREQGHDVRYFGHPLLDVVHPQYAREEFCDRFALDPGRPIIGLLPGSRTHEIANNLPAIVVACAHLINEQPSLQFAVPLASSVSVPSVLRELRALPWIRVRGIDAADESAERIGGSSGLGLASRAAALAERDGLDLSSTHIDIRLLHGMAYDVLAHSRAAVVTSGTATLEAAILGCPMVIIYRGSWLTYVEWKLRGRGIKFVGMPNIILDRQVCWELLHHEASPRRISAIIAELVADSVERETMIRGLLEVRAALGNPGAIEKTADVVVEMLER